MVDGSCPYCNAPGPHRVHARNAGRPRYECKACRRTFRDMGAPEPAEQHVLASQVYVITSAVSGTTAHAAFWRALEAYANKRKAKLLVVPVKYHNPTSRSAVAADEYDPRVEPYLYSARAQLANGLTLMADVSTQPTAARPLSGLQTFSGVGGQDSLIYGHPKIALESVATRPGKHAKLVLTTGAVTRPYYTDSKAGKKGEFHHVMGAVVVEVEGKQFHLRHIHANNDGSFWDLGVKYDADGGQARGEVKVLACGDLHAVRADKDVLEATFFAKDSMVATLHPARIVMHDVLDFQSASHHNNFFEQYRLKQTNRDDLLGELRATCELLDRIAGAAPWAEILVVDSNHDNHFTRWLLNPLHAHDLKHQNARVYHETKGAYLAAIDAKETDFSPLTYWADKFMVERKRVRFLGRNDSVLVDKIEYGQHGDLGPNGARGAIDAFRKVGSKLVIGHSHTPGISDGVYQIGTSSVLDMGYNKGFSSWMHTHCIHYANGKRALVNIINGAWHLGSGK